METSKDLSTAAASVIAVMPDPLASPAWPESDDHEAWGAVRADGEATAAFFNASVLERTQTRMRPIAVGPLAAIEVSPLGATRPGVIAYVHGGAFVQHSAESTLFCAAQLASETRRRVVSLDYPLAPRSRAEATVPLVVEALGALLGKVGPRELAIAGDSAGGGLAVAATQQLLERGWSMAALVLGSPWADLRDRPAGGLDADRTLSWSRQLGPAARAYADTKRGSPTASPLLGAFGRDFPPTFIVAGEAELLAGDASGLRDAITSAGGVAEAALFAGMPHVFHLLLHAVGAPEAMRAYRGFASFLDRHLG